jgi:hypothetical protein
MRGAGMASGMTSGYDSGALTGEGRMVGRAKITAEETAELQRLYSELPSAIAEAAQAVRGEHLSGQALETFLEGDEKVDTIIKRICQLTEEPEAK